MKLTRYLLASSAVAAALLVASPAAFAHSLALGSASVKGSVSADSHDRDRDAKHENASVSAKRAFLSAIGAAGAGVVTSVNGSSSFTLKSRGMSGTTTVATNASTTYKVNGVATTSSALSAGSRVIVFGTTDSSGGITATLVSIFNVGIRFFAHLFH